MNWDWEAMGFIKKELSHFPEAIIGINEIEKIRNLTFASKVDKNKLKFDLSLARGLEYYTGAVFELTLDRLPHFGSVMGGGRYDNLLARFGVESMPATGVSLGVDRLVVGLEELGLLKKSVSPMKALVVGLGEEMESNAFSIASSLRSEGIDCEIYLGENRGLKKQMEYAHRQGITYCVIIGTEEWNFRKAQIKNMKTAEQVEYDLKRVAEVLKTADGE
jgi:histidyl-tRNA synthetase